MVRIKEGSQVKIKDFTKSLPPLSRVRAVTLILLLLSLAVGAVTIKTRQASAQTETGFLEICKESDPNSPAPVTGSFTFTVNGQAVSVPVGQCSQAISLPAGTATITETSPDNFRVTAITTDIPERRVSADLENRTATVQIVAGDVSTQTIVRFRNSVMQTGFLEICKEADPNSPSPVTGSFSFTVGGTTISVPVGQCSQPISLPAGTATVTEAARSGFRLTRVRTNIADRLISADLENRTATVQIVAGDVSTQTIVRFRNSAAQSGQIKVCKIAGAGVDQGDTFTFNVGGRSVTVLAGSCSQPLSFRLGTEITVTETNIPSGLQVSDITVNPSSQLVAGSADLSHARVRVIVGTGVTEVSFTNQQAQSGQVKVCKEGGPGVSGNFTFNVSGVGSITVTAGNCSLPFSFAVGTHVTVTETNIPSNIKLVSITSVPSGRTTEDLANKRGVVTVGTGVTEVTFRNELRTPSCAPKTCTYTVGGYKNNPDRFPSEIQSSGLIIGGRRLTRDQLVSVLNMSPGQNGSPNFAIQVARQLIAALANVSRIQAAGGCVPEDVTAAIQAAQRLLNGCVTVTNGKVVFTCTQSPSSTVTVNGRTFTASEIVNILSQFNEATDCDDHDDDDDDD